MWETVPDQTVTRARHARFEDFYRTHRDPVAHALAVTLRDATLGAEAADEAMARAYERWRSVRKVDNQPGWVYRVGLNWARDRLRKSGRERTLDLAEPLTDDAVRIDPSLDRAVADLPLEFRSVIVLRYFLDWNLDDISRALDIPLGTVKSRLNRAHARLAPTMEDLR
jgi:RNA polymerase sigma factor (sigma-70 family)